MKSCKHSHCVTRIFSLTLPRSWTSLNANSEMFQCFIPYFSKHPSISSASLQAFCFSANEQQLKQLREILQNASPHRSRREDRDKQKDKTSCLESIHPRGSTGNLSRNWLLLARLFPYLSTWPQKRVKNCLSSLVHQKSVHRSPLVVQQDVLDFFQCGIDSNHTYSPKMGRKQIYLLYH